MSILRMVFSVMLYLSGLAILYGLLDGFSGWENNLFSIRIYISPKAITVFLNAQDSKTVISPRFYMIHAVLRSGHISEITAPIIQCVVVDVVAIHSARSVHNQAVHFSVPASCVETLGGFIPMRNPFPLTEPFKIFVINQCKLALGKWYLFHKFFHKKMPAASWVKHETVGTFYFSIKWPLDPAHLFTRFDYITAEMCR